MSRNRVTGPERTSFMYISTCPEVGSRLLGGRASSHVGRYCWTRPYASDAVEPSNSSSVRMFLLARDRWTAWFVSPAGPGGSAAGGSTETGVGATGIVSTVRVRESPPPLNTRVPALVLICSAEPPRSRSALTRVTRECRRRGGCSWAIGMRITHSHYPRPRGTRMNATTAGARISEARRQLTYLNRAAQLAGLLVHPQRPGDVRRARARARTSFIRPAVSPRRALCRNIGAQKRLAQQHVRLRREVVPARVVLHDSRQPPTARRARC
jgi:hypothetical protein